MDQGLLAGQPSHCFQSGSEVCIIYSVDLDPPTCGTTGQFM